MTSLETCIREAVEKGGYFPTYINQYHTDGGKEKRKTPLYIAQELIHSIENEVIFLDPLFWQALGRARGWAMGGTGRMYHDEYGVGGYPSMFVWQEKWHRFIDHLAEGKDAESFFAAL